MTAEHILELPIYPVVKYEPYGLELEKLKLSTAVRILRDGKWYRVPVVEDYYVADKTAPEYPGEKRELVWLRFFQTIWHIEHLFIAPTAPFYMGEIEHEQSVLDPYQTDEAQRLQEMLP